MWKKFYSRGGKVLQSPTAVSILSRWFGIHYSDEPGFLQGRSDVNKAIKAAFDDHGITIPFPIRTLDFGIKGGQTLQHQMSDQWVN